MDRTKFDEIRDSIINGQHSQAFQQMVAIEHCLDDLMHYFDFERSNPDLAIEAATLYFRRM